MPTILDVRPFTRDAPGGKELFAKLTELWFNTTDVKQELPPTLRKVGLDPATFVWGDTMSGLWLDILVAAAQRKVLRELMELLPDRLHKPQFATFLVGLPEIDSTKPFEPESTAGPFDRRVLAGRRPFMDRDTVRLALADLSTEGGARVLVVDGPTGSGRSHVWFLVTEGAREAHPTARAERIRPSEWVGEAWGARKLAEEIGTKMDWGAPPALDAKAQGDALLAPLLNWCKSKAAKEPEPVWLVIDDLDPRFVDEEALRLAAALAAAAATSEAGPLRVVLLAFAGPLAAEAEGFSAREAIAPIDEHVLRGYFSEVAESVGEQLTAAAVDAIVAEAVGPPPYANPLPLAQFAARIGKVADAYARQTGGGGG